MKVAAQREQGRVGGGATVSETSDMVDTLEGTAGQAEGKGQD